MASLLFYQAPTALDRNQHKNLKLNAQNSLSFTSESNSIPVAGFEFFQTSRDFPILFIKNAKEEFMPIAVLSLKEKGHDLGDRWEGLYIPSFVRRYPFALGDKGVVVFDQEAPHIQEKEGKALFDDEGEATDSLKEVVKFLELVDRGFRTTTEFSKALAEKGLLETFKGSVKFSNTTVKLEHLYAINEKKLHEALNEKECYEWFNKGWLGWAHAHLHSLSSLGLVAKRSSKANAEQGSKEGTAQETTLQ